MQWFHLLSARPHGLLEFLDILSEIIFVHIYLLAPKNQCLVSDRVCLTSITTLYENTPKCVGHNIYQRCHLHIIQKTIYLTFNASSSTILGCKGIPATDKSASYSLLPENCTRLFLLSLEHTNLSVAKTLWRLLSYSTVPLTSRFSKSLSGIVGIYILSGTRISQTLRTPPYPEQSWCILQLPCAKAAKINFGSHFKNLYQFWPIAGCWAPAHTHISDLYHSICYDSDQIMYGTRPAPSNPFRYFITPPQHILIILLSLWLLLPVSSLHPIYQSHHPRLFSLQSFFKNMGYVPVKILVCPAVEIR